MKVTEWPASDCPVESDVPFQQGPIFESHGLNPSIPPVPPVPSPDREIHWNHPAPIPPTFHLERGKSQFNFPQHVW